MNHFMHWPWNAVILLAIGYALFFFVLWRCRINERRDLQAMRLHAAIANRCWWQFDNSDTVHEQKKP